MSPILASQADAEILLRPRQVMCAYFWLTVTLAFGSPLFYKFCAHISKRSNWLPPTKWRELPAGYNPILWLFTVSLCWITCNEFSKFYGVRVYARQIELIHVWPKDAVLIADTNLLKVKLVGRWRLQLLVWTRDGKRFDSTIQRDGLQGSSMEAFHSLEAAMVQP